MHKVLLALLVTTSLRAFGQLHPATSAKYFDDLNKTLKPSADSLANDIDTQILTKAIDDTISLHNFPQSLNATVVYIEKAYCDQEGSLKKAIIFRGPEKIYTYYFDNNMLFKAVAKILETKEQAQFYYGTNENLYLDPFIWRIAKTYPRFKPYFENFSRAKTFLKNPSASINKTELIYPADISHGPGREKFQHQVDFIVQQLEFQELSKTKDDTIEIRDEDDPNRIAGIYVEQNFRNQSGKIRMAIVRQYDEQTIYYYDQDLLIKAIVTNLKTGEKKQSYFSQFDNKIDIKKVGRITDLYPEFSSYFAILATGRSLMK